MNTILSKAAFLSYRIKIYALDSPLYFEIFFFYEKNYGKAKIVLLKKKFRITFMFKTKSTKAFSLFYFRFRVN